MEVGSGYCIPGEASCCACLETRSIIQEMGDDDFQKLVRKSTGLPIYRASGKADSYDRVRMEYENQDGQEQQSIPEGGGGVRSIWSWFGAESECWPPQMMIDITPQVLFRLDPGRSDRPGFRADGFPGSSRIYPQSHTLIDGRFLSGLSLVSRAV